MTKKTTPDLMRLALNKKWNVTHNFFDSQERIVLLQGYIIRTLLLGNVRQLVRLYKHVFPMLKYLSMKHDNKEVKFMVKSGQSIITLSGRAEVYALDIQKFNDKIVINAFGKKPNLLIGAEGKMLANIVVFLSALLGMPKDNITLNIQESNEPHPVYFAKRIARNLVNRMSFKKALDDVVRSIKEHRSIDGFHITLSGKLNGSTIARSEKFVHGVIPKSTLMRKVVSCNQDAYTVYGVIGVKIVLSIRSGQKNMMDNKIKDIRDNKRSIAGNINKSSTTGSRKSSMNVA